MKQQKKFQSIVIAGGGTGGHLFPGLSIAHYFYQKQSQCNIRFVGTKKGIEYKIIPTTPYKLYTLPIVGLYRTGLLKKIFSLVFIPLAILRSIGWIFIWKPDFVLGVGGYASGPFLLACIILRKKFFIQEQNTYPGITNKFLGKYTHLSFLVDTDEYGFFKNSVVVGNPIRPEIHALWKNNNTRSNQKFQITILGGSQGSQVVNQLVLESLQKIKELKTKISIVHQSGLVDYQKIRNYYQNTNFQYKVSIFFEDMVKVYQNTHLFICRSGAGVFEMVAAGRIGILIPIANSSGEHQKKNAKKLAQNAGFFLLEEKNATADKIATIIKKLFKNQNILTQREKLASAYYQGNASEKIYNQIMLFFQK